MRKIRIICICLTAVFLAACNGEEQTTDYSTWDTAVLQYTYPDDGQKAVPLHAPLVLRFSDPVTSEDPEDALILTADGQTAGFSLETTEDHRSLILTPDTALAPATEYVLTAGQLESEIGGVEFPEGGIAFTTRVAKNGAADQITANEPYVTAANPFQVARMIPDDQELPLMDFSTLRLQFTQPVERATVAYGGAVRLEDSQGDLVPAHLITSGACISIDPVNDLVPNAVYRLRLASGMQSLSGASLDPGYYADLVFQPKDSAPRETLVQRAPASDDLEAEQCNGNCENICPLTGMPINCVPIKAVLLGDEGNSTQQTGNVHAELAFAPNYPDVTPLRIPRGSLLTGTNLQVNIGGEVPAGYETGEIRVKFISDASGYLMPNPYSDATDAPRQIRLYMDVAMNAAGAEANGGLSQDLLHLELVGTSIVEDGIMVINAIGVIEPRVLGLEEAYGILSFRMESYRDQVNAPAMAEDMTAPAVQSWVPGGNTGAAATENAMDLRPGDPIIVNFTEPLDRNSIKTAIDNSMLTLNGGTSFEWYLDGATLVIRPNSGLEYDTTYNLSIPSTSGVTDLAGNPLNADFNRTFTMPAYTSGNARSPIVLTAYPGYPCANTGPTDLNNPVYQGRCLGGQSGDDRLPIMDLPANRPIRVQFSQVMNPDTITAGSSGSFVVEQYDGATWSQVPGRLKKFPRRIRFYPDEAWQGGVLYRYILRSDQIADESGNPLQTNLLQAPGAAAAGPDLVNYFRGAPKTDAVFQVLRNLPTIDVNSNFAYDPGENDPEDNGSTGDYLDIDSGDPSYSDVVESGNYIVEENSALMIIDNHGGIVTNAWFDTREGNSDRDLTWYTHALNVEIVGPAPYNGDDQNYSGDAIRVNIYPTRLVGSNLDMWITASILGDYHNPTGPQVIRMRYENGGPIPGWIKDINQQAVFETTVDLYLDAPYLDPAPMGTHNLHSYQFTLELQGKIIFLEDGRMIIRQINADFTEPVNIGVEIDALINGSIDLRIPKGGNFLNYMQLPLKE